MAKPYPLYDYLRVVCQKDSSVMKKSALVAKLASLPISHAEMIQSLIIHHNFTNGRYESVPYNGKLLTKNRGVQYNLSKIPDDLEGILIAYLEMIYNK